MTASVQVDFANSHSAVPPAFEVSWPSDSASEDRARSRGTMPEEWIRHRARVPHFGDVVFLDTRYSTEPSFELVEHPVSEPVSPSYIVTSGHENELERYLADHPRVREALHRVMSRLLREFRGIEFVIGLYRDPEESWSYPLVTVVTPPESNRSYIEKTIECAVVEMLDHIQADAENWFDFTTRFVWPEARR